MEWYILLRIIRVDKKQIGTLLRQTKSVLILVKREE